MPPSTQPENWDIVRLEALFQSARALNAVNPSSVAHLAELGELARALRSSRRGSESYALQIASWLPDLSVSRFVPGLAPETLAALHADLQDLSRNVPEMLILGDFVQRLEQLRRASACAFAFVGCFREALEALLGEAQVLPDWMVHAASVKGSFPCDIIDGLLAEARRRKDRLSGALEEIWKAFPRAAQSNAAWIPLVESNPFRRVSAPEMGALYRTLVSLEARPQAREDEFRTNVVIERPQHPTAPAFAPSLRAARTLLREMEGDVGEGAIRVYVEFRGGTGLLRGGSAGLGLAALFVCSLLKESRSRSRSAVSSLAAITGEVSPDGDVGPVADEGLPHKVRSAFFSPVTTLVVPQQNLDAAGRLLAALEAQYPHRRLSLRGASHLRDVFDDRRVTVRSRLPLARYVGERVMHHRTHALVAAFLLMIALVTYSWLSPLDRDPRTVAFSGSSMVVKNASGDVVDQQDVGSFTVQRHIEYQERQANRRLYEFCDATGDGTSEIVYVQFGKDLLTGADTLVCYDARARRRIWSFAVEAPNRYPLKPELLDKRYRVVDLEVAGAGPGGATDLVVAANHYTQFPSMVMRLDVRTGVTREVYTHVGQLTAVEICDLDSAGTPEIICAGVNNAHRTAVLFFLQAGAMEGHSPAQGDYVPQGLPRAREVSYLSIPRTVVGQSFTRFSRSNGAVGLVLNRSSRSIIVTVDDVSASVYGQSVSGRLLFHFGFDRALHHVATADDYDVLAERLVADGLIPDVPDDEYFAAYVRTLRELK